MIVHTKFIRTYKNKASYTKSMVCTSSQPCFPTFIILLYILQPDAALHYTTLLRIFYFTGVFLPTVPGQAPAPLPSLPFHALTVPAPIRSIHRLRSFCS